MSTYSIITINSAVYTAVLTFSTKSTFQCYVFIGFNDSLKKYLQQSIDFRLYRENADFSTYSCVE